MCVHRARQLLCPQGNPGLMGVVLIMLDSKSKNSLAQCPHFDRATSDDSQIRSEQVMDACLWLLTRPRFKEPEAVDLLKSSTSTEMNKSFVNP